MIVVYVDSIFILNALMDYFILLATYCLAGIPMNRKRCAVSALIGAAYAVAVFLPGLGWMAAFPMKLAVGFLMTLTAFGCSRRLPRLMLLLLMVSCGFAGCVLGLGAAAGGLPIEQGIFYTDVDAAVLLAAAGGAYIVFTVVFRAGAGHGVRKELVPVVLEMQQRKVRLTALLDTGNGLRDPATGRPVLIVWSDAVTSLWPAELRGRLRAENLRDPVETIGTLGMWRGRCSLIPYRAVGTEGGLLLGIRVDSAVVNSRKYKRLMIALSSEMLGEGFAALWGSEETGGKYNDFTDYVV